MSTHKIGGYKVYCLNCGGKGYIITKRKHIVAATVNGEAFVRKDRFTRRRCKRCDGKGYLSLMDQRIEETVRTAGEY